LGVSAATFRTLFPITGFHRANNPDRLPLFSTPAGTPAVATAQRLHLIFTYIVTCRTVHHRRHTFAPLVFSIGSMDRSGSRHGSQRLDITTYGRRLVVKEQEQLIDYSEDKRKRRKSSPSPPAPDTPAFVKYCLHVGSLPYDVTEHDLRKLFSGYNIADARVPTRHRDDRSRGCGFVDMNSLRDAQNAISSLSGVDFLGRVVTVMMSRSNFWTAAVREDHDDEPPEKRVKRGSAWEMDLKNATSQDSMYNDLDNQAPPGPPKLSLSYTLKYNKSNDLASPPPSILALELARMWTDEYSGPDISQANRSECLARLLLQLDVPESKLHEHISRTLMARAASQKQETSMPAGDSTEKMAAKLERHQWKKIEDDIHARVHPSSGERAPEISSSRRKSQGESHKRSFGSVEWTDGRQQR
jgi:hypothetical protein